jgi:hypothetical protein
MRFYLKKSSRLCLVLFVFVMLALGSGSCANSGLGGQGASGYGQCTGPIVDADVYLDVGPGGTYSLTIIPISVTNPGDVATITIANNNLGYETLMSQVNLIPNQQISAGDLETFNLLAITQYQPNTDFFSGNATDDTVCNLPQPGDTGH